MTNLAQGNSRERGFFSNIFWVNWISTWEKVKCMSALCHTQNSGEKCVDLIVKSRALKFLEDDI